MKIIPALLLAALACGCGSRDPQAAEKLKHEGRDETKLIRNTQNIGYSGRDIANHVDAALDANDKHNKDLQQQMADPNGAGAAAPGAPPPPPPPPGQ